jgi:hypothetical protein
MDRRPSWRRSRSRSSGSAATGSRSRNGPSSHSAPAGRESRAPRARTLGDSCRSGWRPETGSPAPGRARTAAGSKAGNEATLPADRRHSNGGERGLDATNQVRRRRVGCAGEAGLFAQATEWAPLCGRTMLATSNYLKQKTDRPENKFVTRPTRRLTAPLLTALWRSLPAGPRQRAPFRSEADSTRAGGALRTTAAREACGAGLAQNPANVGGFAATMRDRLRPAPLSTKRRLSWRSAWFGSGGGFRTPDPAVNSRLLYH